MPSQPPLPPLLTSYLSSQPECSLTVISSILGATSNWLVLRFLYAAINIQSNANDPVALEGGHNGVKKKVVLVSFLRGWEFWRSEAKRLGLDLARLADKQQFAFVDGLSELFSTPQSTAPSPSSSPGIAGSPVARTTLPLRQPGSVRGRSAPIAASSGNNRAPASGIAKKLHFSGHGVAALDVLEKDITNVIEQLRDPTKVDDSLLLIIDQPDLLLAASGLSMGIGASEMTEWVLGLQQRAHAMLLTLSADSPLIHNASVSAHTLATPLEREHAAFAIGLAHRARSVIQLRTLQTGAARDVSGVLRISRGGVLNANVEDDLDEKELLYYIQRDGAVRVFGRGEF